MALAKDRAPPCSFYGSYMLELGNPSSLLYPFEEDHSQKQLSLQGEDDLGNTHQVQTLASHSPPLSTSSSATSSNGFTFHGGGSSYTQPEEAPSLINFNKVSAATATATTTNYGGSHLMHTNGSPLSFQPQNCYSFGQPNDYPLWEGSIPRQNVIAGGNLRVFEEANCLQTNGGRGGGIGAYHDATGEWLFGEGAAVALDCAQESPTLQQTSLSKKRSLMEEENVQILKKQCNITRKQQPNKPKPSSATKDPQSIAAKNRRERISERLKILQDLVPNGSKVDLVTMLEKAISYVKFLQLQVKVLASDEFWPAGGGKLPDVTQVREAIDAILSSQRDNKSSSTSH